MPNPYQNPYGPYPQPNYGNPYYGGFGPQQPAPQQPQQRAQNVYDFVNGVEGAKSYRVNPGQSVLLMDSDQPIAYMKEANAMGQATIRYFRLTEVSERDAKGASAPAPSAGDFVSRADFDALVARVNALAPKGGE